jgi:DNA-binding IclR family transcriptional regulator
MSTTDQPYPGTQAVLRAIALLKAFTQASPELNLSQLSKLVNLNRTTTYRLLKALESEGLVVRNPETDAYRLGPEAIVIGMRALESNDLRSVSRKELELLAEQTRETATLEVLRKDRVLILDEIPGSYFVGATPSVDTLWPVHATSTGKAILAYLTEDERRAALTLPLEQFTDNTITSLDALAQEFEQIRSQGYAIGNEELEVGFSAVSAPIRDHAGRVAGAISIGGPSSRLTEARLHEIAPLVVDAANRISAALGARAGQ